MKAKLLSAACLAVIIAFPNFAAAQFGAPAKQNFGQVEQKGSPSLAAAGETLGYCCEFGAFDLTANDSRGLFILSHHQFPSTGNRFYNEKIEFYTSPYTVNIGGFNYDGDLYKGQAGGKDRYWFFGKDDIQGPGRRWLVFFNAEGYGTAFIANVAKK